MLPVVRKPRALLLAPRCLLAGALLLGVVGCSSEESEASDSIRSSLLADPDFAGTELTDAEAECIADGTVEGIGVESLRGYGLIDDDNEVVASASPDDLSADDAEALAAALVDCVDADELLQDQLGTLTQQLPDDQAACVAEVFDDDVTVELLAARFRGEEPSTAVPGDVEEQLRDCVARSGS